MDYRTVLILLLAVLLVCSLSALAWFYWQTHGDSLSLPPLDQPDSSNSEAMTADEDAFINVYFLTEDHSQLQAEKRLAPILDSITDRVRRAITELLRGPLASNLISPIPPGTELENVFWSQSDGTVYLSFTEDLLKNAPGHALSEWAIIYSIVNTVTDRSPAIKQVQFLIEGEVIQNPYTIWDWTYPFQQPDRVFNREGLAEGS